MPAVISKDGTVIYYEVMGNGPVIILVDGALSFIGHRDGIPLANALADEYTVIVYDRRGRGKSTDQLPYAVEKEIEDIEALINENGAPVSLYGFSSGAVLALQAAAILRDKISTLVLLEPPFSENTAAAKNEYASFCAQLEKLVSEGKNSEAVAFFLSDMLPPEMLESAKHLPEWKLMESVAPTLIYDCKVLGNGSVPANIAAVVDIPTLVLVGGESPEFKHAAAMELRMALPAGKMKTLYEQSTLVPPEILAPVLKEFLSSSVSNAFQS